MSTEQSLPLLPHQRLDAWRIALELLQTVRAIADSLPKGHAHLADQMRPAVVSTCSNLAEAAGRRSKKDQADRFAIARGDDEAAAAVEIAMTMGLAQQALGEAALELARREYAMLTGLIKRCGG